MFQEFLLKKLLKSKLGDVPEGEIDRIIKLVKENPALFQKIAGEVEAKIKSGKGQMDAVMEVMRAHEEELKKLS